MTEDRSTEQQTPEIERFDVSCDDRGEVYPAPGGEFVRYDDHAAAMQEKDAKIAELDGKLADAMLKEAEGPMPSNEKCPTCGSYVRSLFGKREECQDSWHDTPAEIQVVETRRLPGISQHNPKIKSTIMKQPFDPSRLAGGALYWAKRNE